MRVSRGFVLGCAAAAVVSGCAAPSAVNAPTSSAPASTPESSQPTGANPDPAEFVPQVLARSREAGVDAQLVLAILYNEDYKPHDPQLERSWQQLKPDAAFGVANMHRATFEQTRRGRPFAGRNWAELPDDPDLAIRAEAWYLHDLAAQLPTEHAGEYTADELLALGYNAGPGNMKAFARGTAPGAQARAYVEKLRANWQKAGAAVKKN